MDAPNHEDLAEAGIGHNRPDAIEALTQQVDEVIEVADSWAGIEEIEDETQAGRCSDFLNRVKTMAKEVEEKRVATNKPLRDECKVNDAAHNPLKDKLGTVAKSLLPLLNGWLKKEEDRKKREAKAAEEAALEEIRVAKEAQKKAEESGNVSDQIQAQEATDTAEEAVEQADELSNNTRATVKGNLSERAVSMRSSWSANITDFDKALEHFREHPKVRDVIEQLAGAAARSPDQRKIPLPGVEFVETKNAV